MATIGKLTLDTELRTTKFENKLDKLESDLNIAEQKAEQAEQKFADLSRALNEMPKYKMDTKEYQTLANNVEKANIAWQTATNNVENLKNGIVETRLESDKMVFDKNKKSIKNAGNLIKKLKKVGLTLFSIRSVYSLVSKASSAYLSQDVELAQKLQNVWTGLGSFMAPVLEYLSNIMLKALGYLNAFIYALTKQNFIAKANEKIINKQAKAQAKLNKEMLSFDEINKLSDNTVTTSGGATSGAIDIPELNENIVKKLQDMAYWLKENWEWLKIVGEGLGIIFGASAIGKILANIGSLIGIKGIGGLTASLKGIPKSVAIGFTAIGLTAIVAEVAYLIADVQKLKDELAEERKNSQDRYREILKNETDINKLIDDQNRKRALGRDTLKDANTWYNKLFGLSKEYLQVSGQTVTNSQVILDKLMEQYNAGKLNKEEQEKILQEMINQYNYNLAIIKILDENGIKTNDLVTINSNYAQNIQTVSDKLGIAKDKLGEMIISSSEENELTKGIYNNIENINKTKLDDKSATYTITTKADTKQATKDYSNFFSKLGLSISTILDPTAWGKGFTTKFKNIWSGKKLAVGGIVYNPGAGVPVGTNAIAGEAGAEGVLPLTNPETMARLGKEIGKWITLNMNITNQIDGRVLNKRLETIKREDDFSTNGGVL